MFRQPCTSLIQQRGLSNYVAERMLEAPLDVTLPYVLTFRMRPTPVRLRLLRAAEAPRRWVLVARG